MKLKKSIIFSIVALVGVLIIIVEFKGFDIADFNSKNSLSQQSKLKVNANYGRIPMHFVANYGQMDHKVKFHSRGSGYTLFLTSDEAVLTLRKPEEGTEEIISKNSQSETVVLLDNSLSMIMITVSFEAD